MRVRERASFFNREEEMSAAELVMMFHFYFLGNPEGLGFDVPSGDHLTAVWEPWRGHLAGLGVEVASGQRVSSLREARSGVDSVVIACDVDGVQSIAAGTEVETHVDGLTTAPPYAVLRLWCEGDAAPHRPAFAGVAGCDDLDSVSLYHRLEARSRSWATRRRGSVVEVHAYAARSTDGLGARLVSDLERVYPETRGLHTVDRHYRVAADCPGFPPGSHATRPGVDIGVDGVYLAGDFVRLSFPTALMERAAASGVVAANGILKRAGVRQEPVYSVPRRGFLAALRRAGARPRGRRGRETAVR